ncbi:hypothetical protein [Bacillus spizizenii]|uniref:hypothetical protein n=1 Tax=Bacillus spizizenii TaxID=96241 RepID=UPI00283B17B3|nr:hypothetical protein [Bacillus spizizenii]MDR4204835.1 hypothetical protein [Bacillus spizizenii ATCC 6633 = JCM 2499]
MKPVSIVDIIQNGKKEEKYRIVNSSADNWVDVQVTVKEQIKHNEEPTKSVYITDLSQDNVGEYYLNCPVPLIDAIISAEFIKEENEK